MHFANTLHSAVDEKRSVLCLGLDPHWDKIPDFLKEGSAPDETILKFLIPIIDACAEHVACVKPQIAFFEIFGSAGFSAFEKVCMYAKAKGLPVIVDAKRGDIGSTASAYAEAYLGKNRPYDALTINPYMGEDTLMPFVEKAKENEKGLFVLVKTSNPGSGDFQDAPIGDELLHEAVARSVSRIGADDMTSENFSSVGAVVGATYPDELSLLRSDMPGQIFLIPGYGAQGGTAEDIKPAFYENGHGAIVNSSRGILFAFEKKNDPENFAKHAGEAAQLAKEDLARVVFNR
jgi:orotidine-5'-phosphate decarboxylase